MTKGNIYHLLDIMSLLRDENLGCPWDIKQSFKTVIPFTLEEAYEVLDAINKNDMQALKDELGDLLLNVIFHAQMAKEKNFFDFDDVVKGICDKMIRRHPHVFGDVDRQEWANSKGIWEKQKSQERKETKSALDGVALALPALTRGVKLQNRAARVGFDWDEAAQVLDKIEEEIKEVRETIENKDKDGQEDEIGDLLFACANLARKLNIEPEKALRRTNDKFEKRFHFIEKKLKEINKKPEDATLEEMEEIWQSSKGIEKKEA